MSSLNTGDPCPLLAPDSFQYADAQAHSAALDAWLGLDTERIERELARSRSTPQGEQHWIGLPTQALLTPYIELRALLAVLAPRPGTTIVDLGAGYGRLGWVIARFHPGVRFVGYEIVPERVAEGLRRLIPPSDPAIRLEEADVAAPGFLPEEAEIYFIYDFGSRAAIEKALQDLRAIARRRPITVVGRGRASRDAIERSHPWLASVVPPEHFAHYSIYRSSAHPGRQEHDGNKSPESGR